MSSLETVLLADATFVHIMSRLCIMCLLVTVSVIAAVTATNNTAGSVVPAPPVPVPPVMVSSSSSSSNSSTSSSSSSSTTTSSCSSDDGWCTQSGQWLPLNINLIIIAVATLLLSYIVMSDRRLPVMCVLWCGTFYLFVFTSNWYIWLAVLSADVILYAMLYHGMPIDGDEFSSSAVDGIDVDGMDDDELQLIAEFKDREESKQRRQTFIAPAEPESADVIGKGFRAKASADGGNDDGRDHQPGFIRDADDDEPSQAEE